MALLVDGDMTWAKLRAGSWTVVVAGDHSTQTSRETHVAVPL